MWLDSGLIDTVPNHLLLYLQNTSMIINFKNLKYIKIIFEILKQCSFNPWQRTEKKTTE